MVLLGFGWWSRLVVLFVFYIGFGLVVVGFLVG